VKTRAKPSIAIASQPLSPAAGAMLTSSHKDGVGDNLTFKLLTVMMKKIFAFTIFLLSFSKLNAQTNGELYFTIVKTDDSQISLKISDDPKITFIPTEKGNIQISTKNEQIEFWTKELSKIHYCNNIDNSVQNIKSNGFIVLKEATLEINVVNNNTEFAIYNTEGKCLINKILPIGSFNIPISQLSHGLNLIKLNNHTFKLYRK
jgi:hypothetical protein